MTWEGKNLHWRMVNSFTLHILWKKAWNTCQPLSGERLNHQFRESCLRSLEASEYLIVPCRAEWILRENDFVSEMNLLKFSADFLYCSTHVRHSVQLLGLKYTDRCNLFLPAWVCFVHLIFKCFRVRTSWIVLRAIHTALGSWCSLRPMDTNEVTVNNCNLSYY